MDIREYIDKREGSDYYWIDTYIRPVDSTKKVRLHRSLKTKNFKEAIVIASELVRQQEEKKNNVLKNERNCTLCQLVENYLFSKGKIKDSTLESYRHYSKPILKYFGNDFKVAIMTQKHVALFRKWLEDRGSSRDTVHHLLAFLKSMYKYAFDVELTQKHLLNRYEVPKQAATVKKYFSVDDVRNLLNILDDFNYPPTFIALQTGMRKNEILDMKYSWIDFENGNIKVPADSTKSTKDRNVPMSDELSDYLLRRREEAMYKDGYVVSSDGGSTRYYDVKSGFKNALKKIGRIDCNFHTTRKTFATFYLQKCPEDYVGLMGICGWEDVKTAKKYATETQEYYHKKRENVNNLYGQNNTNSLKNEEVAS